MRKSAPYVVAALVAVCFMMPAGAADSPAKPGKWQITTQMEIPGMPFKMPPVKFEMCLTAEDLKDPQKSVPSDPKAKCTVSDYNVDGNTVTWTMDCPKQDMKGKGTITYTDDSYTGNMKMTVGEQEMTSKYSGKWLGECTKK